VPTPLRRFRLDRQDEQQARCFRIRHLAAKRAAAGVAAALRGVAEKSLALWTNRFDRFFEAARPVRKQALVTSL
jgi:hypothetical protein